MNIRQRREELRKKAVGLQNSYFSTTYKQDRKGYERSVELRKKQDEVYKQWKFYDGIIKASQNGGKNGR